MEFSSPPPMIHRSATPAQSSAAHEALAEHVAAEARALVELEFERMRDRTTTALAQTKSAALVGATTVACSVLALGAVMTALMLAAGAGAVPALVGLAILLLIGATVSGYAYLVLPNSPIETARGLAKLGWTELRRQLKSHTPSVQRG